MTNFFRVTNSDGRQLILMTEHNLQQVKEYYKTQQLDVHVACCVPSFDEVLHTVYLG